MSKFKLGSMVKIISGDDKGKQGKLLAIKGNRVFVSGFRLNRKVKVGSSVEFRESYFDISNIALPELEQS